MSVDDGMRIVRGKKKVKWSQAPRSLDQVEPGKVVLIAVRVGAHLAGPAQGALTTCLCRPFDVAAGMELYQCGDLIVRRTFAVAVYEQEDLE